MTPTDKELTEAVEYWIEHYITNGYKHYGKISPEKALEMYWDNITERVIQDIPEEIATTEELEKRLTNLF